MYIRNGVEFDINEINEIEPNIYPVGWFHDEAHRVQFEVHEVHPAAQPSISANQKLVPDGFEQDAQQRWVQKWLIEQLSDVELAAAAAALVALKSNLTGSVDDTIAAICGRWTRFQAGYEKREAAARTFKAASYVGDPGVWVTAFSTAAGMSNTAAANLIIAQADALHGALEALEALRMTKYGILAATSPAAAQTAHDSILSQAAAIAAAL